MTVHYQTVAWIDAVLAAVLEDGAITTEQLPFRPYLPTGYVATMAAVLEGPFDRDGALRRARLFDRLATEVLQKAARVLGFEVCA